MRTAKNKRTIRQQANAALVKLIASDTVAFVIIGQVFG